MSATPTQSSAKYINGATQQLSPHTKNGPFQAVFTDLKILFAALAGSYDAIFNSVSTDTITEKTTAAGVNVDSVLMKDGGVSNAGGTAFAGFYFDAIQNNIVAGAGGAVSVANYLTTINSDAGGDAFTLANGTQKGQMKKVLLVADGGGDGVVTPATAFASGATTATFNDAGDYIIAIWTGTAWRVLENSGVTLA